MGIVSNLITAQARGKVGAWVFRVSKGQSVASGYQPAVRNPKSPAQTFVRNRMAMTVAIYRSLANVFSLGFRQTPNPRSAYNGFVAANNPEAFNGDSVENLEFSPGNFLAAKGNMGGTKYVTTPIAENDATFTLDWTLSGMPIGGASSDVFGYAVFNRASEEWSGGITSVARSANTGTFPLGVRAEEADSIYIYPFWVSVVTDAVSDGTGLNPFIVTA